MAPDHSSVKVAVRIRPQSAREKIEACRVCTFVMPGESQISIGKDKRFTYDHVFDIPAQQEEIYKGCVEELVEGCFEGYNATVLAYGQTGSGKTYTMGTGFDISRMESELGVIPRAVGQVFGGIKKRKEQASESGLPEPEFVVSAQFMELYNEEVIDLFDTSRAPRTNKIAIHEDANGNIFAVGVTSRVVKTADELMKCLQDGALNRTTASTQMNAQSSRSHAIFSIHLKQTRAIRSSNADTPTSDEGIESETDGQVNGHGPLEFETLSAKFHFTDLAGSERLKRTGATGDRAKEGIAINCGLLALGNVISALGDPAKSSSHVPYRDSKLTRLLQDSLGGNSRTLMVACVSPSDSDFMETINTLKYANRARNIKNKVVVNQDKASQQIQALRAQIASLQLENMEYKTGKRLPGEEGFNDLYQESSLLRGENEHLRMRIKAMQETIESLTSRLTRVTAQQVCRGGGEGGDSTEEEGGMESIIENYIKEIENLRSKIVESESMCANLRRRSGSLSAAPMSPFASRVTPTPMPMAGTSVFESSTLGEIPILDLAKKEVETLIHKKEELEIQQTHKKENKENIATSSEETDQPEDDVDESSDESEAETELNLSESEDEESENMQKELVTLTCEIDIKQKLIDEFEAQERRMNSLRHQYESKVRLLETKIRTTEDERDKVLKNMDGKSSTADSSKIRTEFQKKLDHMKKEVGKLKEAKKGHDRLLREQSRHQQQLKKLKTDLELMKTTKVRIMKQMKEQQKKGKVQDSQRLREITQLKRDSRKKESQLRSLESRFQAKDRMVQRKKEELEMLRKQLKPISGKLGRRKQQRELASYSSADVGNSRSSREGRNRKRTSEYSTKTAKLKWQKVEKKINDIVNQRETVFHMERQMDRLIKERERLQKTIQRCERRKERSKEASADLRSELESLHENFEFVNEQIEQIQSEILQVEESMESDSYISTMIETCFITEARYLLEHLLTTVINKSAMALESQIRIKELESNLDGEMETSKQAQELMRYMLGEQADMDPQMRELMRASEFDEDSDSDSSPERPPSVQAMNGHYPLDGARDMKQKMRRKTVTPQELLHGISQAEDKEIESETPTPPMLSPITSPGVNLPKPILVSDLNETFDVTAVTSTPNSVPSTNVESLRSRRETYFADEIKPLEPDNFIAPMTPPPATSSTNKSIPSNVFSRLTRYALSSPRTDNSDYPVFDGARGRMNSYVSKTPTPRTAPLVCVQIAEGHHKPVLCLQATDHLLFSGSKDRTVKIWNLVTSQEIMSLDGHPNNVNVVRHCPTTGLVYTVSLCNIKVWDIRSKAKCIKVISSSGQIQSLSSFVGTMGRTNRMPDNEQQINDIALSKQSKCLFSASGTSIKIWDLRKYSVVGKLTGHSGQIMTMATATLPSETVITGAKDHYVKSFDVSDTSGNISPTVTLEPPHMDGVESLATSSVHNALFSGSRDKSIKKWELKSKTLVKSEYQAHQSWVCAMDVVNFGSDDILVSGGRSGMLKMWDVESMGLIGDIRAHSDTINYVASNKNFVFTASSDSTIKVWKVR